VKTLLKRASLFFALPICISGYFSLPAAADSTAALILSTQCQGGYTINIWRNYRSGELLYRAISPNGNLSLGEEPARRLKAFECTNLGVATMNIGFGMGRWMIRRLGH
jgi:hypothetical protein